MIIFENEIPHFQKLGSFTVSKGIGIHYRQYRELE